LATTTQTDQFKVDCFNGGHNFKTSGGLTYKALLIKVAPSGTYDKTLSNVGTPGSGTPTTANVGTDEASGTGYTSGGFTLTNVSAALFTDTAVVTFSANPSWGPTATISATALVIYTTDATNGTANRTVAVYDFGGTQTVTANTLTVTLPAAGASTGLIRSL
jgi:hypothetical protein